MKFREGFVSNSSSTSFIVSASTTTEVFKQMMAAWAKDTLNQKEWHDAGIKSVMKFLDTIPYDFNGGIRIPFTCNYETYICPAINNKSYVMTCNNHDWSGLNIVKYYGGADEGDFPTPNILFTDINTGLRLTYNQFTELDSLLYKFNWENRKV